MIKRKIKTRIGIDPGTHTGVAVTVGGELVEVRTLPIHRALLLVEAINADSISDRGEPAEMYIEDPNTWRPFKGHNAQAKIQGAGSIKRDFAIWRDFCQDRGLPMHPVKLQGTLKKLSPQIFERITGFEGRTSQHARDAAMLVFEDKQKFFNK